MSIAYPLPRMAGRRSVRPAHAPRAIPSVAEKNKAHFFFSKAQPSSSRRSQSAALPPVHCAILEDEEDAREMLRTMISKIPELHCSADYGNGFEALDQIADTPIRLVLIDLRLPGISGIECIRRLKELCPELKLIVVTSLAAPAHLQEALAAGADGYLPKSSLSQLELRLAIETVLAGNRFIAPSIIETLLPASQAEAKPCDPGNPLTPRQQEVLDLICQGFGRKTVADQLKISESTVSAHLQEIYTKLHAHGAHEARFKLDQLLRKPGPEANIRDLT